MTISATILQDSIANGVRITTFELIYNRFIHSELMTHRVFSRNAASSRAIPIKTMNNNIQSNPAMPIHWGKNQAGMQAGQELEQDDANECHFIWLEAMHSAVKFSNILAELGLAKQAANRITEPFSHMKTIVTSTEWSNWYELRAHPDAQPEIQELAKAMWVEHIGSEPLELKEGEWHLPYIHLERVGDKLTYSVGDVLYTLDEAKRLSVSCCAQVSYRKNDLSLEKADAIYDRLVNMKPFHASPFEHQASPLVYDRDNWDLYDEWPIGSTHIDKYGNFWSNNFREWLQNRSLM
jgi:thymidylate synthase ThyX